MKTLKNIFLQLSVGTTRSASKSSHLHTLLWKIHISTKNQECRYAHLHILKGNRVKIDRFVQTQNLISREVKKETRDTHKWV